MKEIAYLDGRWMKIEEATVPVWDRGYLFADALYEVVVSYDGRIWALERHLLRLERGIRELGMEGVGVAHVRSVLLEAHRRSGISDAHIYLQLTRGVAPRKHDWTGGMTPSLLVTVRQSPAPDPDILKHGVSVVTTPDIRWGRCDIKTTNLLPNCLALHKAHEAGAYEAVLIREGGIVTEAAADSLFIVKGPTLITREDGPHILPGITQGLIVETARRMAIPVERRPFGREELFAADEVFLTGTTLAVVPVVRIDDRTVGTGRVGAMAKKLLAAYMERRRRGDDAPEGRERM